MSRPQCSTYRAQHTVKNGYIHTGKQRFLCKWCGRQFIKNPTHRTIDADTRASVDRLLLERISMARIARAVQVSEQWLQDYVNVKAAQTSGKALV
ncbi:MAG: hypothetical protein AAGC93_30850 [Cyanobacteria bacterium P01_F01_bin.53]